MLILNRLKNSIGRAPRPLGQFFHGVASNRSKVLVPTDELLCRIADDRLYIFDASWHMPAANRSGQEEFFQTRLPGKTFFLIFIVL